MLGLGLGLAMRPQIGVSTPSLFSAFGAGFDGANDHMARGGGLTGAVDASLLSFSFWHRVTGNEGVTGTLLASSPANRILLTKTLSGRIQLTVGNAAGTILFAAASPTSTALIVTGWAHYGVSVSTNHPAGSKIGLITKNGVSLTITPTDAGAAFDIDTTLTDAGIGANASGATRMTGDLAEFMMWPGVFLDWTSAPVLAKVYNAGKPVDPGADGSLVTGSPPIIYQSVRFGDPASRFSENRGSGGSFSITGALDLVAGP